MRRALAALATVVTSLGVATPAAATHRFPDVPDDGTFAREIAWADTQQIVSGYFSDGTFRPYGRVTRIEAMAVLYSYALRVDDDNTGPDTDDAGFSFADVVAWADENQLWADGASRTQNADRDEIARYLARYHSRLDGGEVSGDVTFSDTGDSPLADEISWAATAGIVNGFQDGTFRPDERVTRGQIVAIVHNYQVAFDGGVEFRGP